LLLARVLHDRRRDRVQRERRHHDAGVHGLVEEDELLDRRAALAAVLLRPADTEPAVLAHLLQHLSVQRPGAFRRRRPLPVLSPHEAREVFAEVAPERFLLLRERDLHGRTGVPKRAFVCQEAAMPAAIVTGATSGIGRALAMELAS